MTPIRLRLALCLEKAQDRPGIIDFLAAKTIAIIPVTQDRQGLVLLLRTGQDPYFFWRETDPIGIGPIDDTADFQIIQAAENTFFGDAQNACENCQRNMGIVFECRGKSGLRQVIAR